MSNRFDYIDHENSKLITELLEKGDHIDTNAVNVENSIRYFLKNDQNKIKIGDPSVSKAEKQMKGVATIFNDKKMIIDDVIAQIDAVEQQMNQMIEKLEKNGRSAKITKMRESMTILDEHKPLLLELQEELDEAKKVHLENLKRRILKAERLRHFKNL